MFNFISISILFFILNIVFSLTITNVKQLDINDYKTWLLKSVCVNIDSDIIIISDPYYNCPEGSYIRKYQSGDVFPYNNYEQMNYQISDSFSLLDLDGNIIYLHTFDYEPFNQFNQYSGSDGYDVYLITNETISISNTKDGGGYGSTFYGKDCQYGNGWVVFPRINFLDNINNEGYYEIAGVYWEKDGDNNPGKCPSSYSTNTLTVWNLINNYSFSGINNNPIKLMDTLVSYHGFETDDDINPTVNFILNGHLEVFYFTKEYGITRWEVWIPLTDIKYKVNNLTECSGSSIGVFKDMKFQIQTCHDWSNVKLLDVPILPVFPIVNANLLKHFHFDSGLENTYIGMNYWYRYGDINWKIKISTSGNDGGINYLSLNCSDNCDLNSIGIYQDIPVNSSHSKTESERNILYGVNARTCTGTGSLTIALQFIDFTNSVIWQDEFSSIINQDNGDGRGNEAESIYLSSKFIYKTIILPEFDLQYNYSALRLLIKPDDHNNYYILDAFVNRFPSYS